MDRKQRDELSTPAGQIIAALLFDEEQRMRVRAHMAASGATPTRVAREIGISPYRLRAFLSGGDVFGQDARKLDAWCAAHSTHPVFVHAEVIGILIFARWGPGNRLLENRRAFADTVIRVMEERNIRIPPFLLPLMRGP